MSMEFLGVILVPFLIVAIGFLYLFFAFKHDDYVQERGCREFHRLYPDEFCPHDCSFWAIGAIENERRNKIKKRKKEE